MLRVWRAVSLALLALAGLSMAHTGAYLLTFRCWSCHDELVSATHALFAGSSVCVVAIVALVLTLVAGRAARASGARVSAPRLFAAQAGGLVILQVVQRRVSSQTLADPTIVLEFALLFLTTLLLARFVRVVEEVVHAALTTDSPNPRGESEPPADRLPRVTGWSRTVAYNATGFLLAPPLPA